MYRPLAALKIVTLLTVAGLAAQGKTDNWPSWRGPDHTGTSTANPPLTWNDTTNVRWKVPIPGRGMSTPVIWGDKVFLTTAIPTADKAETAAPAGRGAGGGTAAGQEHRFEVLALDRTSGKILWQRTATTAVPHEGYHRIYGSFASNLPATDGQRVYAFFGSRGLYTYDLNGKVLWQFNPGIQLAMHLAFGEGTGVVVDAGRVYLQYDSNIEGAVIALDGATGKELWRAARNHRSSWSTPLVAQHAGKKQLIVSAQTKVTSYDTETGKVIWEVAGLGMNPIPQPIQHGDLVVLMSGYREPKLMVVKLGRTGDLTGTDAIAWETTRGTSYTASPALHDGRLYIIADNGQMSVFNATTGAPAYVQTRLPKPYNFKASPLVAGGRVYLASEEGDVIVVRAGETHEILATNTLTDQSFVASPIAVGNDLFLRSRTHLIRISEK